MPFLVDGGPTEVSPESRAAATPERLLGPSASGVCLGRWPKPWGRTASPGAPISARRWESGNRFDR